MVASMGVLAAVLATWLQGNHGIHTCMRCHCSTNMMERRRIKWTLKRRKKQSQFSRESLQKSNSMELLKMVFNGSKRRRARAKTQMLACGQNFGASTTTWWTIAMRFAHCEQNGPEWMENRQKISHGIVVPRWMVVLHIETKLSLEPLCPNITRNSFSWKSKVLGCCPCAKWLIFICIQFTSIERFRMKQQCFESNYDGYFLISIHCQFLCSLVVDLTTDHTIKKSRVLHKY